ncbi:hypothetical protein [Actinoplanes sp. NBRC 103695]|uniref:hypothetical protein n=1 Tax=Actinoplanes sp. NBRC 103695 TaxID=3032202 RepID=UPI0024A09236|nr:hypothetical protein [Actinoplanes sp. NBRC 103695]GLY92942.1 hypothetical protein Acsp02_01980 [Actinoplanes sp. NBRC 103695]
MPLTFETDKAALWPQWAAFRDALRRLDWSACHAVLDVAAAPDRTRLISYGAEERVPEDFLRGLVRQNPGDPAAFALLGRFLITTGWNIRTAARAQHVSKEQWRAFYHWLNLAEQVLIEGAARHPSDPAVWTARLLSARGISLGLDEETRRYARLAQIDEHHLPAQVQHLQQLLPKWSGTFEAAHAFARERMLAAPPGAPQGVLVAEAHIEHAMELSGGEQRQYLEHALPDLRAAAERSVLHPAFVAGDYTADLALGDFAAIFRRFGDREFTARVFGVMGRRAALDPWDMYFDGGSTALHAARIWAGEK